MNRLSRCWLIFSLFSLYTYCVPVTVRSCWRQGLPPGQPQPLRGQGHIFTSLVSFVSWHSCQNQMSKPYNFKSVLSLLSGFVLQIRLVNQPRTYFSFHAVAVFLQQGGTLFLSFFDGCVEFFQLICTFLKCQACWRQTPSPFSAYMASTGSSSLSSPSLSPCCLSRKLYIFSLFTQIISFDPHNSSWNTSRAANTPFPRWGSAEVSKARLSLCTALVTGRVKTHLSSLIWTLMWRVCKFLTTSSDVQNMYTSFLWLLSISRSAPWWKF